MKKVLLVLAAVGTMMFVSCGQEAQASIQKKDSVTVTATKIDYSGSIGSNMEAISNLSEKIAMLEASMSEMDLDTRKNLESLKWALKALKKANKAQDKASAKSSADMADRMTKMETMFMFNMEAMKAKSIKDHAHVMMLLSQEKIKFDEYKAKMDTAFTIVSAPMMDDLMSKLDRKMTIDFIGGDRMVSNEKDIVRAQKRMDKRVKYLKKRIATQERRGNRDDVYRLQSHLDGYMTKNAAMGRMDEDKKDIADIKNIKAKIAALKAI